MEEGIKINRTYATGDGHIVKYSTFTKKNNHMKNEEQLLQEARKEAENVYPFKSDWSSHNNTVDFNQENRLAYVKGYLEKAKKQKSELIRFLDSIRYYEHESGKAIYADDRESEEFVRIYMEQELK